MAHFAQIDENGLVLNVVVVNDEDTTNDEGIENEETGVSFLKQTFGDDTLWKKTSYNRNIRKNYASKGGTYDSTRDAFIDEKPFNSWILNEETCTWEAPIERPIDNERPIHWDEDSQDWIITEL